ncbi:zinc finger protein 862-like [Mytilus edulis]|uniref:zinc finger protein 862-like n=1 Tax=Mytilus edulis TaxID=6550 RepID=UPI0039EE5EDE
MSNIYWMAKHNLSTSLYNGVKDLLDFHGVESVSAIQKAKNAKYTSSDSVLDMQIALAKVVDEEIIEDMKASIYYSVMLDESTDRTTEKTLMLYVRYIKSNVSVTRFLSVLELSGGTADVIFTAVKTLFDMYDLDFSKCISISTDGASVMTGIRSGVTTKFSEQNPFIIKTHCIAHRLALASSQAANSINYLKKYQGTLNEVYKYYHHSCKHMSELKAMATIFDKAEKRFQEVFSTRWLSFEGSVSSLLHNFDILIGCLLVDEEGGNIVAGGLVRFISTYEFLAVSHFMGDVMGIVCRVSRVFQREDLTFSVIKDVIDPAYAAILGMKSTAGPKLESFLSEVPSEVQESGNFLFGGNLIKDSPSQRSNFESLRVKFIDQLVLNLQSRFPSQQIFQSLSIFDPQFVPSAGSQEMLSYGKEQVDYLCKHFGQAKGGHKALISEVHFREEWLMFKQVLPGYKGVRIDSALSSLLCKDSVAVDYPNVANFLSFCLVSALSSVDCERGFSRYNLIKTYLRNRLRVSSVNTLLNICLHPSDLRSFRFRRAFELWCKAKDRRILFY